MARIRSVFLLARGAAWGRQDKGDHRGKGSDSAGLGSAEMSAKSQPQVEGETPNTLAIPAGTAKGSFSLRGRKEQSRISLGKARSDGPALHRLALSVINPLSQRGKAVQT